VLQLLGKLGNFLICFETVTALLRAFKVHRKIAQVFLIQSTFCAGI